MRVDAVKTAFAGWSIFKHFSNNKKDQKIESLQIALKQQEEFFQHLIDGERLKNKTYQAILQNLAEFNRGWLIDYLRDCGQDVPEQIDTTELFRRVAKQTLEE